MDGINLTAITPRALHPHPADGSGWLAAATGFNLAIAVSYLACKPPETHTLSFTARLLSSAAYLLIACLAGTLGTWIALPHRSRQQFRSLVLWQARGWIFLPAIALFVRESSLWAPLIATSSAILMAMHLSRDAGATTPLLNPSPRQQVEKDIFITQLHLEPVSSITIAGSLCLYSALMSTLAGRLGFATLLVPVPAFLLASQLIAARQNPAPQNVAPNDLTPNAGREKRSHSISLLVIAFCCAFAALSAAANPWDMVLRVGTVPNAHHTLAKSPRKQPTSTEPPSGGYQAIVLWPIQKKEKTLPAPPLSAGRSSARISKPWVIPFYGPYWYFKTPGETPGPHARTTHADPLKVNVHSTDNHPLLMQAHQNLAAPIPINCCREIQVVFKNDPSFGASVVGLWLTDSHSAAKATQTSQSLGIKPVASDNANPHSANTSSVEETLSFPLPKSAKIKQFDRITVVLFPNQRHTTTGRKVAIESFILLPN